MGRNNKNHDHQQRTNYRGDENKISSQKDAPPAEKFAVRDDTPAEINARNTSNILEQITFIKSALTSLANTKFAKEKDIKDVADFVIDARKKIDSVNEKLDNLERIKNDVQNLRQEINNLPRRNDLKASINSAAQNLRVNVVDDSGQSVIKIAEGILKIQKNFRDNTATRFDGLETRLKNIADSTEVIQSLPGKIDGLSKILSDKGLQLKQDFPTINHDEETLAELTECAEKILQQLSIAARWYARKLPELNAHEESIKNLTAANEKAVTQVRKEGEACGRKAVIKDLLDAYDDVHKLMNPTDDTVPDQLKILVTFLKNAGVEPIYKVGQELEITDGNLMNYEHNIANLKQGKIVITSPGYTFNSDTIEKAKYVPYEEFPNAQKISEPQDDDSTPKEISTVAQVTEAKEDSSEG